MTSDQLRAPQLGVGGQRTDDQRLAVLPNPPELIQTPQVDDSLRRLTELAGDLNHQIRAAGNRPDVPVASRLEERIGLREGARGVDRGLEWARHRVQVDRRSAANAMASTIFV